MTTARPDARQRWRLAYRRDATGAALAQRDLAERWADRLAGSGLPVAWSDGRQRRPRFSIAAPLPVGVLAERDLLDLWLVERRSSAEVRGELAGALPPGHELVALHDVWIGEPPLAGQVVAADYRADLAAPVAGLESAAPALLEAPTLVRPRRGDRAGTYDLRPLLLELRILPPVEDRPAQAVWMRLRHDSDVGAGRPDEVLAAVGDRLPAGLVAERLTRLRLWLTGDARTPPPGSTGEEGDPTAR